MPWGPDAAVHCGQNTEPGRGVRIRWSRMAAIRFEREAGRLRVGRRAVELDESQRAVVALPDDASAAVLGAPGTGKTTTIVEVVADRVLDPRLVARRGARAQLVARRRDPAARPARAAARPPDHRAAGAHRRRRSPSRSSGRPRAPTGAEPPRLVTASELDADIAAILEGHIESGTGPRWPELLDEGVRRLRGFRTELRDLMARATEYDIDPARLRALGASAERPEWVGGARTSSTEYLRIVSTSTARSARSGRAGAVRRRRDRARPAGRRVSRLRLVLVDDLQETTESTLAIVRALAAARRRGASRSAIPTSRRTRSAGESRARWGGWAPSSGSPASRPWCSDVAHRQAIPLRRVHRRHHPAHRRRGRGAAQARGAGAPPDPRRGRQRRRSRASRRRRPRRASGPRSRACCAKSTCCAASRGTGSRSSCAAAALAPASRARSRSPRCPTRMSGRRRHAARRRRGARSAHDRRCRDRARPAHRGARRPSC